MISKTSPSLLRAKYGFQKDVLEVIIQGQSSIDTTEGFQVLNLEEAQEFIRSYGYDLSNPVEKADLFRWEILNRFGGVYCDVDMECVRPLDLVLNTGCKFFAGFSHTGFAEVNTAILGSTPGHCFTKRILNQLTLPSRRSSSDRKLQYVVAM